MWWSRTVLAACLLLAACGFEPMYGAKDKPAVEARYSGVEIGVIPDREGQFLRNQLIDRLYLAGRPSEAPYLLQIAPLRIVTTNLGIRRDATATRAMTNVDTTLRLIEKSTGQVLLQRDVRASGGYNFLDNQFATLVSRRSVQEHMIEELADTIVTQLGLYFSRADAQGALPLSVAGPARDPAAPVSAPAIPSGDEASKAQIVPTTQSEHP